MELSSVEFFSILRDFFFFFERFIIFRLKELTDYRGWFRLHLAQGYWLLQAGPDTTNTHGNVGG